MFPARACVLAALLLPAIAIAQSPAPSPRVPRGELRVLPDDVRHCVDKNEALRERRSALEYEREAIDLEADALARAGSELDSEWRGTDRNNAPMIASYNARSDRHNRRVETQNRRVADFNARIAVLNSDTDDAAHTCAQPYLPKAQRDVFIAGAR